ncbi:MAG: ParB/Srx family N-terminal domain-containing protein [Candidatus Accumulibacter propinquus]
MALDEATIDEYADAFRSGEALPAVKVFFDGEKHWLADGFHRVEAAKRAGLAEIDVDEQLGARRQAVLHSCAANAKHGLRRTNADKRRSIQMILSDSYWSDWSDREIARRCGVGDHLVADVRRSALEASKTASHYLRENADGQPETRTVIRNGTTYQQTTTNIGARPAAQERPTAVAVKVLQPEPDNKPITLTGSCERVEDNQDEIHELRDRLAEMAKVLKETMAEVEVLTAVVEADDKIAAALAEAKRANEMSLVLQSRLDGQANELATSVRLVKSWKRRAEKAEASLAKHAAAVAEGKR